MIDSKLLSITIHIFYDNLQKEHDLIIKVVLEAYQNRYLFHHLLEIVYYALNFAYKKFIVII